MVLAIEVTQLLQTAKADGKVPVNLKFETLPTELQNKILRLEVVAQITGGKVQLKLDGGQVLEAKLEPPLPTGTRLTATVKLAADGVQAQVTQVKLPTTAPQVTSGAQAAQPPAQPHILGNLQTLTPQPTQQPQVLISHPHTGQPLNIPPLTTLQGSLTSPAVTGQNTQSLLLQMPTASGTASVQANITLPQPLPQNTTLTLVQPQSGAAYIQSAALPSSVPLSSPPPPPVLISAVHILTTGNHAPPNIPLNVPLTATPAGGPTPVLGGISQPVLLTMPTVGQATMPPLQANLTLNTPLQTQQTLTFQQVAPQNFVAQNLTQPAASSHAAPAPSLQQVKTLLPPQNTPIQALVTASNVAAEGESSLVTLRLQDGLQMNVKTTAPLTAGQTVEFTLKPDGTLQLTPLVLETGSPRAQVAYHFSKEWPLLKQALSALGQGASTNMEHKAQASIPRPDTLLPTLMQFANAVHSKAAEKFLGDDTVQLLRAFGVDLAPDLTSLNQLSQKGDTPDAWRGLLFPYVENQGEDPQQGGFFWRRQENEENGTDAVRFVLQLELSELGPMQLDGFMQTSDIHLKLRIQDVPEEHFQQNLRELVHETLASYGLTGSIAVERTTSFPFNPLAEIQHQSGTLAVEG